MVFHGDIPVKIWRTRKNIASCRKEEGWGEGVRG